MSNKSTSAQEHKCTRKEKRRRMKKLGACLLALAVISIVMTGCGQQESSAPEKRTVQAAATIPEIETVEVVEGEELVYIPVSAAEASSFDQTPDWAPEPDPMAPTDGDMLTRWSSDYIEGPQWIYFDLGEPGVVSEVIVRWERAHATEYKIQVSNDAMSWKDVYHETAGQAGSMDAVFTPVKCRYVKILGLKRVNDGWGISIWEAEIYGPNTNNPQATTTKEAYLGKGNDGSKAEEAKALIEKMSAPVTPLSAEPFQKGVVYTSWMADELAMPASDFKLAYLKEIGIDTISIMVPAYQETLDSTEIFTNDKQDGDTPTDEALAHAVDTCHKLGLRVMIKPHVDPRTDEARIDIRPSDAWFDSYEKFIVRYARFSQENKVEIFSIGTELEATSFSAWAHRWDQVIDKIKEVYEGDLTYSANWTEYEDVPFWSRMDFIGLDAYFPLSGSNEPTTEELVKAWDNIADKIEDWREKRGLTDKGVILTEIGYPSADGAAQQPWVAITDVIDEQEQADCLDATLEALSKRSWFQGYYIWQVFPQERHSPRGFTVIGKQAEEVIKKHLSASKKQEEPAQGTEALGTQETTN